MTQFLQETKLSIKAWKHCISLAQKCSSMQQLKTIYGHFIVSGISTNTYAISKLINFCALSPNGNLSYASLLFNQIETPNSFVFNSLIRAYTRSSNPYLALNYFDIMLKDFDVKPENHTFHFVLFACGNAKWVSFGKQMHCWVCKNGVLISDGHIQTGVVRLYAKCKIMRDARKMFDEIPQPDFVQWNVVMNGYIELNLGTEALRLFRDMFVKGVEPDKFCVTTALTACTKSGDLRQGKSIHEYVMKKSLAFDVFVWTALVDMYAKCGCVDVAMEVFEKMPKRNAFSWAAMIGGFAMHGYASKAIHCLERMYTEDRLKPDSVVLLTVLTACTHAGLPKEGLFLLDNMKTRYGIAPKHEHYSCVVDLLCRAGRWDEAMALIKRMPMKPLTSVWGAVLSSCRTYKNVELAKLAVKEILELEKGNADEEDAAFVQLSNIYSSTGRNEDASRIHRMISERGLLKKEPGCSMIDHRSGWDGE